MRLFLRRAGECVAMVVLCLTSTAGMTQSSPAKATPTARPAAAPKAMTNADVVKMVQGDLGDELIAMAIRKAARTAFDLTADGLLQLKNAGVSTGVLRVMLDPTAKLEIVAAPSPPPPPPLAARTEVPPATVPSSPTTPSSPSADGASRPARREQAVEQSARPSSVPGGATFTVAKSYDGTYDAILNYLKAKNQTIESASRDTGQIITAMTVSGSYSQTGRSIQITLIRSNLPATPVKVAITLRNRKKLMQTEPWGEPKMDAKQSELAAKELQVALDATN